mgnify:CR=1 FL=1
MVYSAVCSGVPVDGIGLIATLIAGLEVEQLVGSTLFVIFHITSTFLLVNLDCVGQTGFGFGFPDSALVSSST